MFVVFLFQLKMPNGPVNSILLEFARVLLEILKEETAGVKRSQEKYTRTICSVPK